MSTGQFHKLLSPLSLGSGLTLKNRMIKAPQSSWFFEDDGSAGDRVIDFYEAIAAGGVGLVIVSAITWRSDHPAGAYGALHDDRFLPGMKRLVERCHAHGCPVFCQLHHSGASAMTGHGGGLPIGPSDLGPDEIPCPPPVGKPTRGLTAEEIAEDKELYFKAAERAKAAGFDGIEVHCAHGYYLDSFVSRVWNRRDDQYGPQSLENRTRLPLEIIAGLRERLGADYPLGLRMNGQEWGADRGLTIAETVAIAKIFEGAGVRYISVSGYGFGPLPFRYLPDYWPYPEPEEHMKPYLKDFMGDGLLIPAAAAIKQAVNIPVIAVGRLDEAKAEKILEEGKADLVAFGRVLWADPEFPRKVAEGRIEDIVRCTRCGTCEDPPVGRPRRCRVNPAMGRESLFAIRPAEKKKKVVVIGGGPAGMETARVAALRGHDVTLFEKSSRLGGKLPLAAMIKGVEVEDVRPIISYLTTQVGKLNIKVRLGEEATVSKILAEKPDAVVIATGGLYRLPSLKGVENRNVAGVNSLSKQVKLPLLVFGPELLNKLTKLFLPIGKRVAIIGGQIEGLQGAVFLRKRGREVTVLEPSETFGKGIPPRYLDRLKPWLAKKDVQLLGGVTCDQITDQGVVITTKDNQRKLIEADTVMVLLSQEPDTSLLEALKGSVKEVLCAGSVNGAQVGSLIVNAIEDGRRIGCNL